jgi:hypothetical protein
VLPDGTRLVRIGKAPAAEYAAWRYGTDLTRREGSGARSLLAWASGLVTGTILAPGVYNRWRVIHRFEQSGLALALRRSDLDGATFGIDAETGEWMLRLVRADSPVEVRGDVARTLLDRMLVLVNREAAPQRMLAPALRFLDRHTSADAVFSALGEGQGWNPEQGWLRLRYEGEGQWRGEWGLRGGRGFQPVPRYRTVALEIARQEDAERRALEGELRELARQWREAEALARIADSL